MPRNRNSVPNHVRREKIFSFLESTRSPKSITEIADHINDSNDWDFSRKTVERDIEAMAFTHGIIESSGHPAGFKIDPEFSKHYNLKLSETDLQILALVLSITSKQSPDFIKPLIKSLDVALTAGLPSPLRKELDRLRKFCVARGVPSGTSKIQDSKKMLLICEAIRKNLVLQLRYESPYSREKNKNLRNFAPLALEIFGGSYYLLVDDKDARVGETRFKRLSLSRIQETSLTKISFTRPTEFNINAWESAFAGLGGEKQELTKIRLTCGYHLGTYLTEHEIHSSQSIKKVGGKYEVEFQLPLGSPFLRFLAGFAYDIEKLEPKSAAIELKELLKSGLEAIAA